MNDDDKEMLFIIGFFGMLILMTFGMSYFSGYESCHAKWDRTAKAEYGLFSECMVNDIPEDAYINKYPTITLNRGN